MSITSAFIIASITLWVLFDVYIITKKGKHASISSTIIRAAYRHPMIPFLVGFLCGHLFWKMSDIDVYKSFNYKNIEVENSKTKGMVK